MYYLKYIFTFKIRVNSLKLFIFVQVYAGGYFWRDCKIYNSTILKEQNMYLTLYCQKKRYFVIEK